MTKYFDSRLSQTHPRTQPFGPSRVMGHSFVNTTWLRLVFMYSLAHFDLFFSIIYSQGRLLDGIFHHSDLPPCPAYGLLRQSWRSSCLKYACTCCIQVLDKFPSYVSEISLKKGPKLAWVFFNLGCLPFWQISFIVLWSRFKYLAIWRGGFPMLISFIIKLFSSIESSWLRPIKLKSDTCIISGDNAKCTI